MSVELGATALADRAWLTDDLRRAATLHGRATPEVLGTIRWYSASSVLVAPALEPWVHTGAARDPSLEAITFDLHPDGRFLDARSARVLDGGTGALGSALVQALDRAVEAISDVSGAAARALWAVAVDSIANRVLWSASALNDSGRAVRLSDELTDHMTRAALDLPGCVWRGSPRPRFTVAGGRHVVRRSSCCLVYETPAAPGAKCVSCPRQTPAVCAQRLRTLLGP